MVLVKSCIRCIATSKAGIYNNILHEFYLSLMNNNGLVIGLFLLNVLTGCYGLFSKLGLLFPLQCRCCYRADKQNL